MEEAFSVDGTPIEYVLVTVFVFDLIYRYVMGLLYVHFAQKLKRQ